MGKRTQYGHSAPDERDRARSTWIHFPHICRVLANAEVKDAWAHNLSGLYAREVENFALRWHMAGYPVPAWYVSLARRSPTGTSKEVGNINSRGRRATTTGRSAPPC